MHQTEQVASQDGHLVLDGPVQAQHGSDGAHEGQRGGAQLLLQATAAGLEEPAGTLCRTASLTVVASCQSLSPAGGAGGLSSQ